MWDSRLAETLPDVRDRIQRALRRADREDEVRIVAVTKGHPDEAVQAALRAGLEAIGENRIQELEEKVGTVGRDAAEWHMIGHLQRNKARRGVELFDRIHSVDSLRLARKLASEARRGERVVRGYLQTNVSGEASKGGFDPESALGAARAVAELDGLAIVGLMTMAPYEAEEPELRRVFRDTRELLNRLAREVPDALVGRELSMGMSNDFEIAVEEGATCVRLGTVLFGERSYT